MRIRTIDVKMLRDLWGMRGQVTAIAFVIVAGVATYVSMTSVVDSLQGTLNRYYAQYRFGDGFATVRRAPRELEDRLRDVPGVGELETRVSAAVNLEIPGFDEPVSGLIVSIPEGRQPLLNQLFIREGRLVQPGREEEVILNETFAEAHDLHPGDRISAIINGRRRTLSIVGVALSPEFLMQIQPGTLFPDPERYGVMWMGRAAVSAAYDMQGAFNDLSFTLAPGATVEDVIDRLEVHLRRYGGEGAYARADHPSHFFITQEFQQLSAMAALLPTIFLAVAAFLLNIVVTRLITLQREQIAVLKAFGYRDRDVGAHYLKLVLVVAIVGSAAGTGLGSWMGQALGNLYLEYYRFPSLEYALRWPVVLAAVVLTAGAALLGVVRSVRKAVRVPPAEAMRPAAPAIYRPTFVERLGLQHLFDQPTRMIMRNLERQYVKAALTIVGIASSCAILVMGLFWQDTIDYIVRIQYGVAQREDVTVSFIQPTSVAAVHELRALPGVLHAEPFRSVPVRLRYEHRTYDTAIEGVMPGAALRQVIDRELRPVPIPAMGIVLTERLAEILRVSPGDEVVVEVREGSRRVATVPVTGLAQQFLGVAAYMEMSALNRLSGEGQAASGAFLLTDAAREAELNDALRDRPRVASIVSQERAIEAYLSTAAETMLIFTFILSLFAGVIAFGVVYNSARIALSERDRELASLRVLGFTQGEIAYILLGELTVLVLAAIPLGLGIGAVASAWLTESLQTDMYQFPLVLGRRTLAMAAVVVLVAGVISAAIVRRQINRLDLIGVLKTRE